MYALDSLSRWSDANVMRRPQEVEDTVEQSCTQPSDRLRGSHPWRHVHSSSLPWGHVDFAKLLEMVEKQRWDKKNIILH